MSDVAPFVNWAGTARSQPQSWHHPHTVEEVQEVVCQARADGGRVKVVGAGHSFSPIACGGDRMMTLRNLDRFISVDREALTVTVEGGVSLNTLSETLAHHGLALPILGSIDTQTVSGAIATGTHGSSLLHGNLGTGVVAAELVDGRGDRVVVEAGDPRLAGVRVHLGALGIVTRVTLKVVPAFRLRETRVRVPFDEVCDRLLDLAAAHTFVKLWWLPHTDKVWVVSMEPTEASGERSRWAHRLDVFANNVLFPPVLWAGARVPALVPWTNRVVSAVHLSEGEQVGRSDHLFTLPMPPRHQETELAMPLEHAVEALRWCRSWVERGARVGFITEVRFVKGDESWMSPAYGQDVCQLGVYTAWGADAPAYMAAFRAQAPRWQARPHWGKELDVTPAQVDDWYPEAPAFRSLAVDFDPDGVFRNPLLDAVLGP
jgi:FAD/FMN-containing dehydrogenase